MGILDFFRRSHPPGEPQPSAKPAPLVVRRVAPSAEDVERARHQGAEDSIYLHSSRWDELLLAGADGLPPLTFKEHNGRLWFREDTTGKLVKVANRKLMRLGIWSVKVRGSNYRRDAVDATKIRLYAPVTLIREPDNEFDKNAVAVHANGGHIGYFNKQMAASLAKVLDRGDEIVAVITSRGEPINVVAASPAIMKRLRGH